MAKQWTSGTHIAQYVLLAVRTSDQSKKQQGISTLLVDTSLPGIEVRKIPTLPARHWHHRGHLHRRAGAAQHPARRAGPELVDLQRHAALRALMPVRTARLAFDYALDYTKTRKRFGKTIGSFQVTPHKFADVKVMLDTSQALVHRYA